MSEEDATLLCDTGQPNACPIPTALLRTSERAGRGDASPTDRRSARGWVVLELLAVFALGVAVLSFIYLDPRGRPADQIGVPGYDAFYHVKMASMLPEVGLVDHFPWLRHVYFSQLNDKFVSHHYGFHLLLLPFVTLAEWLTGDSLTGGRWAMSTFFGFNVLLLYALLLSEGIRGRWLWLLVFLMLPVEFFGRHAYVRAISPSLMFMLLIVLTTFRERYVLAGLSVAAYTHLYLGAVVFSPVVVGVCAVSQVLGRREDRRFPWRLVMWTTLGWLVGLRTYPYFDGALEFLRMQVFGTGLSPDIAVGAEWNSYGNVWHFAVTMCGPLLAVWAVAVALRLRWGDRLNARELALALLNFAFLLLTLKAKRFIEYWPPFCLLSAAYLAAPVLNPLAAWFDPTGAPVGGRRAWVRATAALVICGALLTAVYAARMNDVQRFFEEWALWLLLATALVVGPLGRIWQSPGTSEESMPRARARLFMVPLLAGVFAGAVLLVGRGLFDMPADRGSALSPGTWGWLVLGGLWAGAAAASARSPGTIEKPRPMTRLLNSTTVIATGLAAVAATVLLCADRLVTAQRDVYCGFDLPAIRDAMGYLQAVSDPGDVVFTDDWDVFPVYFYHNATNNYIVGLDPKFTHWREPELWERYVRITRGQVGRDVYVREAEPDGSECRRRVRVELEDIRDCFGARYVITDRDHKLLAKRLAQAGGFAKLIYPKTSYDACKNDPYLIFEVASNEPARHAEPRRADGPVFLSALDAMTAEQGWGTLTRDRSVSDRPIQLGDRFYLCGLGTHAPAELTYAIPDGYDTFEAAVGVDRGTQGRGSVVVSVEVDGRCVFESPTLTGNSPPMPVRVSVSGGERLTLRAAATGDGNRFDHVDWALARFDRAASVGG